jgi:cytochrome c oxidase cbb3-type subunit 3
VTVPTCRWQFATIALFFAATTVMSAQFPTRPEITPEVLQQGELLFARHCGGCHGLQGQGGSGPDLTSPDLRRGREPDALFETISRGIPGTEMPRSAHLHAQEIWELVSYVETLAVIDNEPISGDTTHGRDIYFGKGNCAACHWLNGSGGRQGPDLTRIGLRRGATNLRDSLVNPSAKLPPRFLLVSAVRDDGTSVQGLRLNEDPFTIQVRDYSQNLHSLVKADLQSLERTAGRSSMPAYGDSLSAGELDDLVAFLAAQNDSEND